MPHFIIHSLIFLVLLALLTRVRPNLPKTQFHPFFLRRGPHHLICWLVTEFPQHLLSQCQIPFCLLGTVPLSAVSKEGVSPLALLTLHLTVWPCLRIFPQQSFCLQSFLHIILWSTEVLPNTKALEALFFLGKWPLQCFFPSCHLETKWRKPHNLAAYVSESA